MTLFDASGAAGGSSAASGAAFVRVALGLRFEGSATAESLAGVRQLSSALVSGGSTFQWRYWYDASATFAGTSSASATGSVRVGARALVFGTSTFKYSIPLLLQGASVFSVVPVVDRQLPPLRAITMGPKTFRWLQPLQRGDLPVFICARHTPVVPYRVTYSLAKLRPDGSRQYVGPQSRRPATGDIGEFYATGRAGESGQAGEWVIEWEFQRTAYSIPQVTEMRFQVVGAAAPIDPRDRLVRKRKVGWD